MYTEKEFKTRWQELHHPTMNVDGDVAFYYGVYRQFHDIAKESAKNMDEVCLLQLVMFVEDAASVSFDSFYEMRYRSVGKMAFYWCDKLGVDLKGTNRLYNSLTKAVADAPESSLEQWMKECVLSGDFQKLKDVAMFYALQDKTIGKIYPNLKYRKAAFLELADGDKEKAKEMLESDLAFNWRDKDGGTLLSRLAECFDFMKDGKDVAANLRTVQSLPLDSYLPLESKDEGRTVTIMKKDNTTLDIIFPSCVSKKKIDEMCFVGNLFLISEKHMSMVLQSGWRKTPLVYGTVTFSGVVFIKTRKKTQDTSISPPPMERNTPAIKTFTVNLKRTGTAFTLTSRTSLTSLIGLHKKKVTQNNKPKAVR